MEKLSPAAARTPTDEAEEWLQAPASTDAPVAKATSEATPGEDSEEWPVAASVAAVTPVEVSSSTAPPPAVSSSSDAPIASSTSAAAASPAPAASGGEPAVASSSQPVTTASPSNYSQSGSVPATSSKAQPETFAIHSSGKDVETYQIHSFNSDGDAEEAQAFEGDAAEAEEVRRRFKFLNSEDQKMTVRRQCHVATKHEDALVAQLRRTIAAYSDALEVGQACEKLPDGEGPELSQEVIAKYKERIKFLEGTIALMEEERPALLPKLSALENTKGMMYNGYAATASAMDEAGVAEVAAAAVANARDAWASLSAGIDRSLGSNAQGGGHVDEAAAHQSGHTAPARSVDPPVEAAGRTFQEPASSSVSDAVGPF